MYNGRNRKKKLFSKNTKSQFYFGLDINIYNNLNQLIINFLIQDKFKFPILYTDFPSNSSNPTIPTTVII